MTKSWYMERGKNAGKNKKESWEYPAKMKKLGRTQKVKGYTRKDGIKVRTYWKHPLGKML